MANPYLTKDNFKTLWEAAKTYHDRLRKPYEELERIKNNHPHPSVNPNFPKTTDGTTASQVRQVPRRAIQQVPYGNVEVAGDNALSALGNYILKEEIVDNSDTQDMVLAKLWKGVEDIQTYGSVDAFTFYKVDGDYFGTDWRVLYKRDCYTEAGKGTFSESNCFFVRAYYFASDLDAIINKEESLQKSAKERGDKYESTWDIAMLKKLKATDGSPKDGLEKSDTEKDRNIEGKPYKVIHGFQKGKGAKFFSYSLDLDEFVREWVNPDPRGVFPIERMYYENDLTNPDGRGIVELVAPLQNYLDSTVQAWQYAQAYNVAPALKKKGAFSSTKIRLEPYAVIDMGADPTADVDALTIDSSSITNFSTTYGLVKSQILNLFGGDDQSVSATVGNPGFSKTDAGVNARQAIVGINDNFIRKRVEMWIQNIWCTQLNIYFSVTQGDREFYPEDKELEKLKEYQSPFYTIEGDKLIVHFSLINGYEFSFEVEASTTKAPDSSESKEHLLEAIKTLNETGLIQLANPQELARRILIQAEVEDVNKLIPDQQPMDDGTLLQNLINAGYPPEVAKQAIQLEKQGYTPEQIDSALQGMMGGQGQ